MKYNTRATAACFLQTVIEKKLSLTELFHSDSCLAFSAADRGLIKELCFGVCRHYFYLDSLLEQLIEKPIKDLTVKILLFIGFYQLLFLRVPSHAAVAETVSAARQLKKSWGTGLINAVLRNFLRQPNLANSGNQLAHAPWFCKMIKADWPEQWREILEANNQHPPLTLRVNQQQISREKYLLLLQEQNIAAEICALSPVGIRVDAAMDVTQLPGYAAGYFSVQDEAAQLAAYLLDCKPQQLVLDACAAPGGKTTHLLEYEPSLQVIAVDNDQKRLSAVTENLQRLQLTATIQHADVADVSSWWQGSLFDRILLDAPCSATGVIRRHPDIKLLRTSEDILQIAKQQLHILKSLWPLIKPQGQLLYATCSIVKKENTEIMQQFLETTADATEKIISADWGTPQTAGRQLLPGQQQTDGFYYCCLLKE
jgi:16S rRNA (cytosine967-C5)-methyltransferase